MPLESMCYFLFAICRLCIGMMRDKFILSCCYWLLEAITSEEKLFHDMNETPQRREKGLEISENSQVTSYYWCRDIWTTFAFSILYALVGLLGT